MSLFKKNSSPSSITIPVTVPDDLSPETISKKLTDLSQRTSELGKCVEETAKFQLVLPFLGAFGWDLANPNQGVIEKNAGKKKRADIILLHNGSAKIVIEVKRPGTNLAQHIKQLAGYFNNSNASIGILTDGIKYWFFSFTEYQPDKGYFMNETPFARISIDKIDLHNKDAFIMALCEKDFDVKNLEIYSKADYTRGKVYGLIGSAHGAAVNSFVRSAFCIAYPSLPPKTIDDLINFTNHHSRWSYRHSN